MRLLLTLAVCCVLLGSGCSYYTSIEHADNGSVYLTQDKVILGVFHRGRIYKCSEASNRLTCTQMEATD